MNVDFSKTPIYEKAVEYLKQDAINNKNLRIPVDEKIHRNMVILNERIIKGKTLKEVADILGFTNIGRHEKVRMWEARLLMRLKRPSFIKTLGLKI